MKILVLTTLYPNSQQSRHGVFIENRVLNFKKKYPDVEIHIMAPVPWFPFSSEKFGHYGKYAEIPESEIRSELRVWHPRYPVIPKVGMSISPVLLALAILPKIKKLIRDGFDFDVIDAHYFYPDGVAAVWLAKQLNKPITVTARGSDIHLLPNYSLPRKMIKWALRESDQAIAVCKALADEMQQIEPNCLSIAVARNGVDLAKFTPEENREALRKRLGIEGFTLLSVGNLIELKGHHLVIDALVSLPDVRLCIAGHGLLEKNLRNQVTALNLNDRVTFLGLLNQQNLRDYYAAADSLVLASSREGWANVILESMACGTPVIATPIWGTPEVVGTEGAGMLTDARSSKSIAAAIAQLRENYPSRNHVRKYAEKFSWDETSDKLHVLFKSKVES